MLLTIAVLLLVGPLLYAIGTRFAVWVLEGADYAWNRSNQWRCLVLGHEWQLYTGAAFSSFTAATRSRCARCHELGRSKPGQMPRRFLVR